MAAVEHGLAALARTMAAPPRDPIPTFEWATVVAGTGEVHVVLDSDPTGTPRPVSDNAAGPVSVGQRVHVAHHGLTLTLLSAPTAAANTDVPLSDLTAGTLTPTVKSSLQSQLEVPPPRPASYATTTSMTFNNAISATKTITFPPGRFTARPICVATPSAYLVGARVQGVSKDSAQIVLFYTEPIAVTLSVNFYAVAEH